MNLNQFLKNKITDCSDYILTNEDNNILEKKGKEEFIIGKLLSHKFRKRSIDAKTARHLKLSVNLNISKNQPILFITSWGGYKMWRLPFYPYPDWAELFAISYYCSFLAPITKIYEPGVKLCFFSDDYIAEKINNIPHDSLRSYVETFRLLVGMFRNSLPNNLSIGVNGIFDIYSEQELAKEFSDNLSFF